LASFNGGGVYQGTLSNCFLIGNEGNATAYGLSDGGGAIYATLYNCTLTGNSTVGDGGGVYQGTLYNCIVNSNTASLNGGGASSGFYRVTLYNCLVVGNMAGTGGGAYSVNLYDCTVSGNTATNDAGGVYGGSQFNTTIYFNSAPNNSNWDGSQFYYCCTTPGATGVMTTNAPLFVNQVVGDYHLQSNSPCINAGYNAYVSVTNDYDGNPRIQGGTVDLGAYEFQNPSSVLSYAWAQQYGLPTDGTADYANYDGDGFSNWQKSKTGVNPFDSTTDLQMLSTSDSVSGATVTWQSVSGIIYYLQRSSDLTAQPAFSTIQSDIVGQTSTTSFTDTTATNGGPYFYRVGVQ